MRRLILAAIVWLLACVAAGQDPANVVRIQCGSSVGSGMYLGDRLCLSCAHLFEGERSRQVAVTFPSGRSFFGTGVKIDGTWDQSLIELTGTPDEPGARLASANPQPGETLTSAGYDHGQTLRLRTGRLTGYLTARSGQPRDWLDMTTQVVSGCSGGPIYNAQGEVVGNLWGAGQGTTVGLMCGRTRRFLLPWNARLEAYWLAQCGGGGRIVSGGWGSSPGRVSPPTAPPTVPTPVPQPQVPPPTVEQIVARLKADPEFMAACKGDDGQQGPPGDPGRDGVDGADAQPIDVAALAVAIRAALPPITVATTGRDGQAIYLGDARLGETLVLPPITVYSTRPDGTRIDTEQVPLGGWLEILPPTQKPINPEARNADGQ